jgi:hypothetical protein
MLKMLLDVGHGNSYITDQALATVSTDRGGQLMLTALQSYSCRSLLQVRYLDSQLRNLSFLG